MSLGMSTAPWHRRKSVILECHGWRPLTNPPARLPLFECLRTQVEGDFRENRWQSRGDESTLPDHLWL